MIGWIITLLAGLKERLAIGAGVAVAILLIAARIFWAGKQSERAAQAARSAAAVREAKHVADEVNALDRADVDRRLARWMRGR
jgi:hypothetical protein